jgi:5-methylcytosine-specific restriction endonuclease McrA
MPWRQCLICGLPIPRGNRCAAHPKPPVPRHRRYRELRERLIAEHPYCHLCGEPFTDPNDPAVVDHVTPRAYGGTDDPANLKPAHRSCNSRKSATLPSWTTG